MSNPEILLDERFAGQITHLHEQPPRPSMLAEPRAPMHPKLRERLEAQGLQKLYSHQAAAYDAAAKGDDVVVVTGTNSGKTLCYNLPALQHALTEPAARMLYMFPTKALAQDQLGRLEALSAGLGVRVATYDGDTPTTQRGSIRKLANAVLTNPDMLHIGILPGHENWVRFLKSLRLIVIDEMHVYRGVFGSNVGGVIRRLLRLCEWHRSHPQIIACSATIGNPQELFTKLTGRRSTLIEDDGSPQGRRTFAFWNPPAISETERMSANVVTSEILTSLAVANQRAIAFNRARVSAELVLRYTRSRLAHTQIEPKKAESYRAGYTPKERRQIEKSLFKGDLLVLSATNAMELGVDVGGLDAVVMNGYPGTIASFFQQAGRAGRGAKDGLAIMVAHDDPLEQFLIRQPERILESKAERVSLNPENTQILGQQLLCAAHERPLSPHELEKFGESALELTESLDRAGLLQFRGGMFFYPSHEPPAPNVNIRGAGGEMVTLDLDGTALGTMEWWRAMQQAHEGAVYLHRGATYLVTRLDLKAKRAEVVPMETDYYTSAVVQSVLEPLVTMHERGRSVLQTVKVTSLVTGYRRRSLDRNEVLGVEDLELPANTFETVAVRLDLPQLSEEDPATGMAGVHGIEHALMAVAPLIAGCDRADLSCAWYTYLPESGHPAVFVYDATPGGVGLCEKLFDSLEAWLSAATQLLKTCPCDFGCPGCLLSARCECANDVLDKRETLRVLDLIG